MRFIKNTLATLALLGSAAGANAAIYYSDELSGLPLHEFPDDGQTYSNTLTNLFAGIDWGANDLVKAVIMFGFADDWDKHWWYEEKVSAKAGSDMAQLSLEVGAPFTASPKDLDVDIEEGVATQVEVNGSHFGGYDYREAELGGQALEDIKNGELDFEVKLESGDVYLKTVQVKIETRERDTPPPVSVPDNGTTLILLGAALGGLAVARRKLAK